jgi:hypothetical protein
LETRPEAGNVQIIIRRRPTRRHSRNRLIRRISAFALLLILGFGLSSAALRYLSPSLFRASKSAEPNRQAVEASRDRLMAVQQEALHALDNRAVYPYSVVPGGVKDVRELKWAADHDPVVAEHYAGFDYDHARVVRLVLARTAYVSYRIGNKVYWTHHRVTLKAGETVITDGKIIARTRCANRVEEVPQQLHSATEPPAAKLDEPIAPAVGTATTTPPIPFQSALMNRLPVPGFGPAPPLQLYDPIGGGNWVPISPPPIPAVPGVCGPGKKKTTNGIEAVEELSTNGKKKIGANPCGGGGSGEVPEPGTWLLMASGLAFVYWMTRSRLTERKS